MSRRWFSDLGHDARYVLRSMGQSPGFTAVAVLALALGIGANTALFSILDGVLFRPLPYADEDALVVVLRDGDNPVSPANFLDWRRQSSAFQGMGAAQYWTANLMDGDRPEQVFALQVTPDLFPVLGRGPLIGRLFRPDEGVPGNDRSVILSHAMWRRRFAGDPGVVGRTMNLSGATFTVVGVMPEGFRFAPFWATKAELWVPLAFPPEILEQRTRNSLRVFARLRPGVSVEEGRAEMLAITSRLEAEFPGTNRNIQVVPLKEKVVGSIRPQLVVLACAVAFVLFIGCANLGHLLLARATARQRENALRVALGASRSRLVRQLITESLLFAVLGAVAGLLLAIVGVRAVIALRSGEIPRIETVGLDGRALLFMSAVTLLAGLAVGLVPALQSSMVNLMGTLRDGGRGATDGPGKGRLRGLLVLSEVALTLVLLVGAGLMIRTFAALQAIEPGFNPTNVVTMTVSLAGSSHGTPERRGGFFRELVHRIDALPGIVSAGAINHLPLGDDSWGIGYTVEGRPPPRPGEEPHAVNRVVLPGYFETMKIPLVRGRDVTAGDDFSTSGVVVINERLAKLQWPGADPIGKRIKTELSSWLTVIGVVKDARQRHWSLRPEPELYIPFLQSEQYLRDMPESRFYLTLVARSSLDPLAVLPAIEREIRSLDRQVTLSAIRTMEAVADGANAGARFYLVLLVSFAGLALVLAILGIYGVMSYSVAQRTHEIGIRIALGAGRGDVLRLLLRQSLLMTASGMAIGLGACVALAHLMESLVYGVRPLDPPTLLAVVSFLGMVAFVTTLLPARRATRIDAMVALGSE
jgi:predicted permease